jgi:hypothetical protein
MKIILIRTGGFIPMTKKAEQEVSWSEPEIQALLDEIKTDAEPGQARDKTGYLINYKAETFPIDWGKIPAKYLATFEEMKDKLVISKK